MLQLHKKARSYSLCHPKGFKLNGRRIFLPQVGWVDFFHSRVIQSNPKKATVFRQDRYWFVAV